VDGIGIGGWRGVAEAMVDQKEVLC